MHQTASGSLPAFSASAPGVNYIKCPEGWLMNERYSTSGTGATGTGGHARKDAGGRAGRAKSDNFWPNSKTTETVWHVTSAFGSLWLRRRGPHAVESCSVS
jgi:hypothetical protein